MQWALDRGWAGWAALVLSFGCGGKSVERAAVAGAGGAAKADMGGAAKADVGGAPKAGAKGTAEAGAGGAAGRRDTSPSSARDAGHEDRSCRSNDLQITFAPDMYSAYIEGSLHTFQLPVTASAPPETTTRWSASDPTMIKMQPYDNGGVLLTMQRAGNVVISANANGQCGTSTLHITRATEEQWQAGNARYNTMYTLPKIDADAAHIPPGLIHDTVDPPGMPPACTSCHGDQPIHDVFVPCTPLQTGGSRDDLLISIFRHAAVPNDYFSSLSSSGAIFLWNALHSWSDISDEQAQGVVVYLRSLVPRQAGIIFGGPPHIAPPAPHDAGAPDAAIGGSAGDASVSGMGAGR